MGRKDDTKRRREVERKLWGGRPNGTKIIEMGI